MDTQTLPLISVLCINLNHAAWLLETLTSIERQTYPNIEVLVADGGSSDNSEQIVSKFGFAKFLPGPDNGRDDGISRALKAARGEYIMFTTSTDGYISNRWFEVASRELLVDRNISLVWGSSIDMDENSVLGVKMWPPSLRHSESQLDALQRWLATENIMVSYYPELNYCVRKNVFDLCVQRNTFSIPELQDFNNIIPLFHFNFMAKGYLAKYLPVLANYGRVHAGQGHTQDYAREDQERYDLILRSFKRIILREREFIFISPDGGQIQKVNFE